MNCLNLEQHKQILHFNFKRRGLVRKLRKLRLTQIKARQKGVDLGKSTALSTGWWGINDNSR